jgi:hypothetical protein
LYDVLARMFCTAATAACAEGRAAAESAALLAGCSRLTPELAAAAASSDRLLLLAAADWSMFELFGVNWLAAVQKAGLDNYLIAALDQVGVHAHAEVLCFST